MFAEKGIRTYVHTVNRERERERAMKAQVGVHATMESFGLAAFLNKSRHGRKLK